ncbi:ATP-binding cassette domain-containing protein [Amycolatopsis sp. DSM 110486]|uniref:ATP-binding cassette domain-containing protein n=1 Tax=Amycolatopsis sp. DSM 110486 TaxID=2865832 RepID=UPI00210331F8|nr:ATP-binding cassette domain-containing protein [Amycolatopsis sp. DSM 110486]
MTQFEVPVVGERAGEPAGTAGATAPAVLSLTSISKSFGPVRALSDVDLEIRAGEVHALVGENGAGKSTLMAVASGVLAPDAGTVVIGGERLTSASPQLARELGLGIVRQEPALLPDLTVAENMAVAVGYGRVGGLRRAPAWAQEQLDPWGMGIRARSRVAELSVEQRFVVEIAKALALGPKVLILDEPTEHLSVDEVQTLFDRVRECVRAGAAVVYISHRIPEVKLIADRITVLRDGAVRGTFAASEVDEQQIVERVIGRALETVFPPKGGGTGETGLLRVEGLSGADFADVALTVRPGEIVGLAGVQGNGQSSVLRALAGLEPATGTVTVAGRQVRLGSNAAAARAGAVYVPADRHGEGVFGPLAVGENTVLATLDEVTTAGLVSGRRVDAVARGEVERLGVKTPGVATPISALSGGNQQKVVLARAMLAKPRLLLAEEPTQGVDAGARVDIYRILREAADAGAAVLLLSSDGVELEGLCDRVLIMSRGSIVAELAGDEVSEAAITEAALTATTVRARVAARAGRWLTAHRWLRGDHTPAAVLTLVFLLLGLVVGAGSTSYFSEFNLYNLLFAAAPLILVGTAQHVVVLGAGIDLSVGPLVGLLVVIASFWVVAGGPAGIGYALMFGAALLVGVVNGLLVTRFRVNAVVATLATYMALQGVYLTLRSTPGGVFPDGVTAQISLRVGVLPVVTIGAVVLIVVLEWALRRTRWGVELRAAGSNRTAAEQLGVRVGRTQLLSYVASALLCFPAAVIVMAQIGIGDGRPSLTYTLSSITIVVLAGASVFGGRGSFLGVLAAALLVQQLVTASPFLGLSQAWSYWLPGLITLGAALLYARLRGGRSRA